MPLLIDAWEDGGAWQVLLEAIRSVVARVTLDDAAKLLGEAPATLHHALNGKHRHVVRMEWLPGLIAMDEEGRIIDALGRLFSFKVVPLAPLTPEEELAALKRALERNLGANMRLGLLAEAEADARAAKKGGKR